MFRKIFRNLKKMWIMIFMLVTFSPAVLSQCQRVLNKYIE